jgi:predicted small metal-binding protein
MEKFACKSLGLDCNYAVTGSTRDEVMKKAMEHGNSVHADLMKKMTKEQAAQFAERLKASIKAV